MSRATDQALLLLTMSWGSLQLIDLDGFVSADIEHTLAYALEENEKLIKSYPYTGNIEKTKAWIKEQMRCWRDMGDSMAAWNPLVLATMASNICEDLLGKIRNPWTRDRIEGLRDAAVQLSYHFTDREKDEHTWFVEADQLLNEMYGLIGFER